MTPDLVRDAVRRFAACSDATQVLQQLAGLVTAELVDWCLADRLDDPDLVTRVAAEGRDGPLALPPRTEGAADSRRSSAAAVGLLTQLVLAPQRMLRLSHEDAVRLAGGPDPRLRAQGELALRLGVADVLVLGLTRRDQLLGVLTVGRVAQPFDDEQIALLADIALLAGLALDGARLLQVQRSVSAALQTTLLPPLPVLAGLTLAARYLPAGQGLEVGGDWYDVFALPNGMVSLVIGDATGHDVAAAASMAELRNLLRASAVDRCEPPDATLARLDRTTAELGASASATCLYAQLERTASGQRLRWSSAGHLPPVRLRGATAELLETPPDLMLGVDPTSQRAEHVYELDPGDVLVLFTDGLVEDRRIGLDDRLDLLVRLVEQAAGEHPEQLCDRLVRELAGREDDVAVLVVRLDR